MNDDSFYLQDFPSWCTCYTFPRVSSKSLVQSYIRGRRCGMEETTEDADLKIYAGSNSWNVTWRKSPTAILAGGNSRIQFDEHIFQMG